MGSIKKQRGDRVKPDSPLDACLGRPGSALIMTVFPDALLRVESSRWI